MKKIFFLFILGFSGISAFATHIIGGEISYQYSGNDVYHIKLEVYRDCINGEAPFDDPGLIFIFDAGNALVQTLSVPLLQVDTIPVSLSCAGIPPNICAERGLYETEGLSRRFYFPYG